MVNPNPESSAFGLLNLNKPSGPTSHDVVAAVRRGAGERRVGHAGTLDPMAEGVLILALGKATRLLEYLAGSDKRYRAVVRLGVATDTYDLQGRVTAERILPDGLSVQSIENLLQRDFVGEILQQPPRYSALKVGGRPAHARVRAGEQVVLDPRPVAIHHIDVLAFEPPDLTLDVRCGAGTYVRSLAHDLGQALGCGAALAGLTRLASGGFQLGDAVLLGRLQAAFGDDSWSEFLLPADRALDGTPQVRLDGESYQRVLHGRPILDERAGGLARAYAPDGRFVAVLAGAGGQWWPKKVFA